MNLLIIFETLVWIVVGLIIARLFEKPLERFQRKASYRIKRIIASFRKLDTVRAAYYEFRLGKWHAKWVVVEGSSADPYTTSNVVCQFDPTPLELRDDCEERKQLIEQEQQEKEKADGTREFFNGPTVALAGVGRGQIGPIEEPFLVLRIRPSDYYTFLATSYSVNDYTTDENGNQVLVRDKYLKNIDFHEPLPEFASALAINLSLITSDGYIVVAKRSSEGIGGYAGYIAPAINECINPVADRSASGTVSAFAAARRGASHELNIDISKEEVSFFTLGVDPKWYFWGLTGIVRTKNFSRADILARRSVGSKEAWETSEIYFLPHNPDNIAKFMHEISKTEKWQPIGIVCIVQTLISEFGIKAAERALKKYPPS